MTIHKEGKTTLIYLLIVLVIFNLGFYFTHPAVFALILIGSVVLYFFILMFFRNPARNVDGSKLSGYLISPADGLVIKNEPEFEAEYFKREMLKVSIFMSMTNVHLNRIPITGKVIYQKYHPGKKMVAFHPKASELNEHNTVVIQDNNGNIFLVRQIAGLIARRIKGYVKEGDSVTIGQELGFIKFGSRVDIFMEQGTALNINLRQSVRANKTVIATI